MPSIVWLSRENETPIAALSARSCGWEGLIGYCVSSRDRNRDPACSMLGFLDLDIPAPPSQLWRDGMNTTAVLMRVRCCTSNPANLTGSEPSLPRRSDRPSCARHILPFASFAGLSPPSGAVSDPMANPYRIRATYQWVAMCSPLDPTRMHPFSDASCVSGSKFVAAV